MRPSEDRAAEIATLLSRLGEHVGEGFKQPAPAESKRPMPQRVLLTPEEAAEALGIGRTTVYALIKSGHIDSVRIGHLRRIPTDALAPCVARLAARHNTPAA
jgi:excisionase family DNA binding protein